MSVLWNCLLLCEGSSDAKLSAVLERLLLDTCPSAEVSVEPVPGKAYGSASKAVEDEVRAVHDEPVDLIFVHRDSDAQPWTDRVDEIRRIDDGRLVPVVPVRMTEAWILASLWRDEEFRNWASVQGFGFAAIERRADPKADLRAFLSRDRKALLNDRDFGLLRADMLRDIDINGDVNQLEAWTRLREDLVAAMTTVHPWVRRHLNVG